MACKRSPVRSRYSPPNKARCRKHSAACFLFVCKGLLLPLHWARMCRFIPGTIVVLDFLSMFYLFYAKNRIGFVQTPTFIIEPFTFTPTFDKEPTLLMNLFYKKECAE